MDFLFLFDLHFNCGNLVSEKKLESIVKIEGDFDAVLLGGDNASLSSRLRNHIILFDTLQGRFNCPIGFVAGNHGLWGKPAGVSSSILLNDIFSDLSEEVGVTYLEKENLVVGGVSFVGTYGHYDFSFFREGNGVSKGDLLRGEIVVGDKIIGNNDRRFLDWEGRKDEDVCYEILDGFEERLKSAKGEKISLSHTIPSRSLNGHPDTQEQYLMEPLSGASRLGEILREHGGEYHFCGHTHARARDLLGKTKAINVGSDYKILRYAILSIAGSEKSLVEREVDFRDIV